MFLFINLAKRRRLIPIILLLLALVISFATQNYVPNVEQSEAVSVFGYEDDDNSPDIIIDAGHGGSDGGAIANDGTIESTLNLDISRKLELLSGLFGLSTLMTRDSEVIDYPSDADSIAERKLYDQRTRLSLINEHPNSVLISIHQNKYPTASPWGTQVYYSDSEDSKNFAKLTHDLLNEKLNPESRRVVAPIPDSVYLINQADCTAILVECGFLSNTEELTLLKSEVYQTMLAAVMLSAYLEYYR